MPDTVLAALPATLLLVAGELGIDPAVLVAESGLDAAALADPDGRVPFEAHARLWASIVAHGPRDVGLALGQRIGARALGVVGHATARADTVRAGLACVERFRRLVLDDAVPRLTVERGVASFVQPLPPRFARLRHPAEAAAAATLVLVRALSGEQVSARAVSFQHAAPDDVSAHRASFGVAPSFGAATNTLAIDAAVLDRPNVRADPELHAYLVRRADQLATTIGDDVRIADRVHRVITEALAEGEPRADVVARRVGVSARTLHRRLAAEGTKLAVILDEVRRERALASLADPSRRVGEVAWALGYEDGSTFARAFRRWTGASPEAWRKRRA